MSGLAHQKMCWLDGWIGCTRPADEIERTRLLSAATASSSLVFLEIIRAHECSDVLRAVVSPSQDGRVKREKRPWTTILCPQRPWTRFSLSAASVDTIFFVRSVRGESTGPTDKVGRGVISVREGPRTGRGAASARVHGQGEPQRPQRPQRSRGSTDRASRSVREGPRTRRAAASAASTDKASRSVRSVREGSTDRASRSVREGPRTRRAAASAASTDKASRSVRSVREGPRTGRAAVSARAHGQGEPQRPRGSTDRASSRVPGRGVGEEWT